MKFYDQIISITLVDDKPPLVIGLGASLMEDGRTWYTEYKICAMIHANYNSHIWVRECGFMGNREDMWERDNGEGFCEEDLK